MTAGHSIFRNSLSKVVKLQSEAFLSERPEEEEAGCKTQRDMRGWRVSPRSLVYSGIWLNFTFHSAKLHESCWKRNQINVYVSVLFYPPLFIHLSFCYFILHISFSQALFYPIIFVSHLLWYVCSLTHLFSVCRQRWVQHRSTKESTLATWQGKGVLWQWRRARDRDTMTLTCGYHLVEVL